MPYIVSFLHHTSNQAKNELPDNKDMPEEVTPIKGED